MNKYQPITNPRDGLIILLSTGTITYFVLLSTRLVFELLHSSSSEISNRIFDFLPILYFFLGNLIFSSITVLHRISSADLKRFRDVALLGLIWTSSIPFLYYQFYQTGFLIMILILSMTFGFVWAAQLACKVPGQWKFECGCFVLGLLALVPTLYASWLPSACRYNLAPEYLKYSIYNAMGGLVYFLKLPERAGYLTHYQISLFAAHCLVMTAAVTLSDHLIAAYQSEIPVPTFLCGI